jgi:PAS domain S-box-containing protein
VVRAAGFQVDAEDLIGRTPQELLRDVFQFDPDDVALTLSRFQRALSASQPLAYEEVHTIRGAKHYGETTLSPVLDAAGACAFILFSSNDVTERRRAEEALTRSVESRRQLETQLQQAHKLQAIGTLAGGIAHDFNNILTAIMGNAELLQFDLPPAGRAGEYAREIVEASHRARDLIKQMMAFSRQQRQERARGRLGPVIAAVVRLLHSTLPRNIEIRTELPADEPDVLMDPAQMQQVLMNLCMNAAHAMRTNGGRLTMRETAVVPDEQFLWAHPHLPAGQHVCLQVSDSGQGMDAPTVQRIFEPFFTTKGPGEGSGLGLAVVHGIVGGHDGAVAVDSTPGVGTTFSIYLPVLEGVRPAPAPVPSAPTAAQGHILFVDDEDSVRHLGKPILERFGYQVTALADGPAALEYLRSNPGKVNAVVSDFSMPGMNGLDLARQALCLQPGLPFVIMTGYAETGEARALGIGQILAKPFTIAAMAEAVRAALKRVPSQPA